MKKLLGGASVIVAVIAVLTSFTSSASAAGLPCITVSGLQGTYDTIAGCVANPTQVAPGTTPTPPATYSQTLVSEIVNLLGTGEPIDPIGTRGFLYGTTVSYGMRVSENGTFGIGPYSLTVTGLACGTTYQYVPYTVEIGSGDIRYGVNNSFSTPACPTSSAPTTPPVISQIIQNPPGGTFMAIVGSKFTPTGNMVTYTLIGKFSAQIPNLTSNGTNIILNLPITTMPGSYALNVTNANGTSKSVLFTVKDQKAAPTNLLAVHSSIAVGKINLSWKDNSTLETGFQIERALDKDGAQFIPIATVGANKTGYVDDLSAITLPTGDAYYRVRSVNTDGSFSGYSNTAHFDVSTKIITVGGIMTKDKSKIFTFIDAIQPNSIRIPLKFKSIPQLSFELWSQINSELKKGKRVLVVGHSQGSAVAYNVVNQFKDLPVSGIYIDPPFDALVCKIPGIRLFPYFRSVNEAVCAGLLADSGMVNWTDGSPFIGTNFWVHNAFEHEDFVNSRYNNRQNLLALDQKINDTLDTLSSKPYSFSTGKLLPGSLVTPPVITGITSVDGVKKPLLRHGDTFVIAGKGFDIEGNSVSIENIGDPDIYYEAYDLPATPTGLIFTLPEDTTLPSDDRSGLYRIKVSTAQSAWSKPFNITINTLLDASEVACSYAPTDKANQYVYTFTGKPIGGKNPYAYKIVNASPRAVTFSPSVYNKGRVSIKNVTNPVGSSLQITARDKQTKTIMCSSPITMSRSLAPMSVDTIDANSSMEVIDTTVAPTTVDTTPVDNTASSNVPATDTATTPGDTVVIPSTITSIDQTPTIQVDTIPVSIPETTPTVVPSAVIQQPVATPTTITKPATLKFTCPSLYVFNGLSCTFGGTKYTIPATLKYVCPSGYILNGKTCTQVVSYVPKYDLVATVIQILQNLFGGYWSSSI